MLNLRARQRWPVRPWTPGLYALGLAMLAACGGASFSDGVYQDDFVRYRVGTLPSGYRRATDSDADLAFYARGQGTIMVSSTCTEYEDVPLIALVNHLLFDTTERHFIVEEDVTIDGRGARHVVAQLALDGVPIELELLVLRKDGCVFDLVQIRQRDAPPEVRAAFTRWAQEFAVLEVTPR